METASETLYALKLLPSGFDTQQIRQLLDQGRLGAVLERLFRLVSCCSAFLNSDKVVSCYHEC